MRIFRRKKENTAELLLVAVKDKGKYDFFAALAKTIVLFLIVYGAIGGFLAAFEIEYNSALCMLALFVLAFVLSLVYETGRKWLTNLTSIAFFLLYFYIAVTNYWVINSGYYAILNRFYEVAREYLNVSGGMEYSLMIEDEYMAVTAFAMFLGMVGLILLNIQLQNNCSLMKVMILTFTPYVIPMYFECSPPLMYIIFMFTGYAVVAILPEGRVGISTQMRYALPVTALVVILFVRLAAFIMPEEDYTRIASESAAKEASREGMERFAQYGMLALFPQNITGTGVSGGMLSKGSAVMPSYETALIVRYTPYNFRPVYLKAFTGVDYIGTSWTQARMEWPGDGNMELSMLSRQYEYFDYEGASQGMGVMEVEKAGIDDEFEYRPYYTDYDYIEEKDNAMVYCYYPDNGKTKLIYDAQPHERYLEVSDRCEDAVRQVCEEEGFGGTEEEIADQIVNYFSENYYYTLRPGFYYGNPDYISHFLLESNKGYCAHFASAATMLFRQMGIPARYVEGYAFSYADVVMNGDLVEGAKYEDYYDGFSEIGPTALIQLEVPDSHAHAWVEIYDSDRGWIIVDPTPSSTEQNSTSFWEAFMNMNGEGDELNLGESNIGAYIESALGGITYVLFVAAVMAAVVLIIIRIIRIRKEKRLPERERVQLEYRRLQKIAAKKNARYQTLRTLRQQLDWIKEKCNMEISDEQENALYQAFFADKMDYDCDNLCRELRRIKRTIRLRS